MALIGEQLDDHDEICGAGEDFPPFASCWPSA